MKTYKELTEGQKEIAKDWGYTDAFYTPESAKELRDNYTKLLNTLPPEHKMTATCMVMQLQNFMAIEIALELQN